MLKSPNHRNPSVVDLTDQIFAQTNFSEENYAALRSGFAGYPVNPRWNITKFQAWKAGRQLRAALAQGRMVVRAVDSLLVPVTEQEDSQDEKPPSWSLYQFFAKKIVLTAYLGA